ncbi:MAG TPA: hypothetical protein VMG31_17365 [Verrucomicrobiae bacterium]|nr:hypothetical protein [Verrucomicrobiae bacterium]
MKTVVALCVVLLCCDLASECQQRGKMPTPPEPMNVENSTPSTNPTLQRRIDLMELQRQADDLARTAQTIPVDMESVRRGVLPKDVIQKLKQIEKLSKRLRSELTP